MVKRKMVATLALLTALGMGLSACGENGGEENDTGTSGQDTGVADTGGNGEQDTGGGDQDTGGGGGDDTGGGDMDTGGGDMDGGGGGEMGEGFVKDQFVVEKEENCENNPELERCSKDPSEVMWGPSSVVTSLVLSSSNAQSCCFDMTDDGSDGPDNALGGLLSSLAGLAEASVDVSVAESIETGNLTLMMEHEGLDALKSSSDFAVNFFLGAPNSEGDADFVKKTDPACDWGDKETWPEGGEGCETEATAGKEFVIDPQSFSKQAFAQARLPNAKIDENGVVTAGPGKVGLQLSVEELGTLSLAINGATIEGKIGDASELDGNGVIIGGGMGISAGGNMLEMAKLGGYVKAKDLIGLVNQLLADCDCAGSPSDAIYVPTEDEERMSVYSPDDPDLCPPSDPKCEQDANKIQCKGVDFSSCGGGDGSVCENGGTICGVGLNFVTGALDLDIDRDGQFDAISIGALFEATGGKIVGVQSME